MPFNAAELESIANSSIEFYFDKGKEHDQTIQKKPLLKYMEKHSKTFSGGNGDISIGVKGNYGFPQQIAAPGGVVVTPVAGSDTISGFSHDDQLSFYTPSNNDRARFPWREMHLGITITHSDLKLDGLSLSNTNGTGSPTRHDGREMHAIVNMFQSKMEDFSEQYARGMNNLFYGDGLADPKAMSGLQSLITDNPAVGVKGGIDPANPAQEWWRNRAYTATNTDATRGGTAPVTSSPANGGALLQTLQREKRQLRRFGGNPTVYLCGSDHLDALETEIRANGNYSDSGFKGTQDGAMGAMHFSGIPIVYDPTLDDLGFTKRAYWYDPKDICLMKMTGEWMKRHAPARPHDYMVLYRSLTCTGQMVARRLNSSIVIDIA